jgi:L-aspartate oxidase
MTKEVSSQPTNHPTQTDFLVIGSGIAGLFFALKASEYGTVTVLTKKDRAESNTNYAQGGISAVLAENDSFEKHIQDTLIAGAGLCNEESVRITVESAPTVIDELVRFGAEFTRRGKSFDLGREGGHSENRIVHAHDATGREVERALVHALTKKKNVQLYEHSMVVELITEHHCTPSKRGGKQENNSKQKKSPTCYGVYAFNGKTKRVERFIAGTTLLASGGCGQVYAHTTNPLIATGDGIAMAYRAGAEIANMEFIQFHPTTLFHPKATSFLISEAVRGFGGILRNSVGERFMVNYDERLELAPRDIVARAIDSELKRRGDECVYLDITHHKPSSIKEHFPTIYSTCLNFGIDITKELIPVVPAAHYCCGGVRTTLDGETSIKNLYACGEVSYTGLHGANRLASNSLLEGVVFAQRALSAIVSLPIKQIPDSVVKRIKQWDETGTTNTEEWILLQHDRKELQQAMWDYVGIVRSTLRLKRALRRIELLRREIEDFYKRTKVTEELLELRNLATVAWLIIKSAQSRKESRGLHFMSDYPTTKNSYKKDTILVNT